MQFFQAVLIAFDTIRVQKLKSFFTVLGVTIGVTFLIAVVSIVSGMGHYMKDDLIGKLIPVNTFNLRQRPDIQMGDVTQEMRREWRPADTLVPVLQDLRHLREHIVNRIVIARANTHANWLSTLPGPLKPAQDDPGQHGSLPRSRRSPEEHQTLGEGARERLRLSRVEGVRERA